MKKLNLFYILGFIIVSTSCSSIYGVSYDYNQNFDFAALKTYNWAPMSVKQGEDTINLGRIKNAVNTELETKGFSLSSANPDFFVVTYVGKQQRTQVDYAPRPALGWGWGWGPYWGAPSVWQYEQGKLTLDFVDPQSKHLIWRGSAKADLSSATTPEKRMKIIDDAVQKILQHFPPSSS